MRFSADPANEEKNNSTFLSPNASPSSRAASVCGHSQLLVPSGHLRLCPAPVLLRTPWGRVGGGGETTGNCCSFFLSRTERKWPPRLAWRGFVQFPLIMSPIITSASSISPRLRHSHPAERGGHSRERHARARRLVSHAAFQAASRNLLETLPPRRAEACRLRWSPPARAASLRNS